MLRLQYFVFALLTLSLLSWGVWQRSCLQEERAAHLLTRTERDLLLLDQAARDASIQALSDQARATSKLLSEERRLSAKRLEIVSEAQLIVTPQEVIDYATSKKVLEHLNSGFGPVGLSDGLRR